MDIQTTLLTSLRKLAEQHTIETLGDRRDYLGASDIGYCPRKIILEKIHPGEHDLATLLRFQRGHMAEDIIARALYQPSVCGCLITVHLLSITVAVSFGGRLFYCIL